MTADAIADVIDAITSAAGLDDHVTSHVLRHTFGTEMTRSGIDLVTVAELMGHASLETTRLYTGPTEADMQRAVDRRTADMSMAWRWPICGAPHWARHKVYPEREPGQGPKNWASPGSRPQG